VFTLTTHCNIYKT